MTYKIDSYLNAATSDKDLRQQIVSVHDDLHAAHKIVDSVASDIGPNASRSDQVLLAVFHELRKHHSSPVA